MPRKPKYNYCIEIVEIGENQGFSVNEIARQNKWPPSGLHAWINRHYTKFWSQSVSYWPKSDPGLHLDARQGATLDNTGPDNLIKEWKNVGLGRFND